MAVSLRIPSVYVDLERQLPSPRRVRVVKKGWKREEIIINEICPGHVGTIGFCGKLLVFDEGLECSWHVHDVKGYEKAEVFYCSSGRVRVWISWEDDFSTAISYDLKHGDILDIPVGLRHKMKGLAEGESVLIEFSTFDFAPPDHPDGSRRIIKGN